MENPLAHKRHVSEQPLPTHEKALNKMKTGFPIKYLVPQKNLKITNHNQISKSPKILSLTYDTHFTLSNIHHITKSAIRKIYNYTHKLRT